jgi:hypothetical protein
VVTRKGIKFIGLKWHVVVIYLTTLISSWNYIASDERMIFDELECMWTEAVVA